MSTADRVTYTVDIPGIGLAEVVVLTAIKERLIERMARRCRMSDVEVREMRVRWSVRVGGQAIHQNIWGRLPDKTKVLAWAAYNHVNSLRGRLE